MCVLFIFVSRETFCGDVMNIEYMNLAIKEALEGSKHGEIPIGAVIVNNSLILAKTHNLKEQLKCSTKHAELLAIEEASKKIGDWRLNDCDLYVTMEPCIMCCGAILQSRIKKVYYLVDNAKFGGTDSIVEILNNKKYNHQTIVEKINDEKLENKMIEILRNFFEDKR